MIIRFSDEEVFSTDSSEYDILSEAVTKIKKVPGALAEIGSRRGGSAKIIIDTLVNNDDTSRSLFCIDPYGNIDFELTNLSATAHLPGAFNLKNPESKKETLKTKLDYNNEMRNRIIPSLYYYAFSKGLNFNFFVMEDTEFFKRFYDGVPVYNEVKKIEDQYALWFLDGPHTDEVVTREVDFFAPRTPVGGVAVFDDIWMYNHDSIEEYLLCYGAHGEKYTWEILDKGKIKASYIKISNS